MREFEPPKEVFWQETFPFGMNGVKITCDPEKFRQNFIAEALIQNANPRVVQELSRRTKFLFEPNKKMLSWRDVGVMGLVAEINDGIFCFLDIPRLVKIPINLRIENRPKYVSDEISKMALVQRLDSIWRHERQHIIQKAFPDVVRKDKKENDKLTKRLNFASSVFFGSIALMLADLFFVDDDYLVGYIKTQYDIFSTIITVMPLASTFYSARLLHRWSYTRSVEVDAYKHTKPEFFTGQYPFNIDFEA